MTEVIALPRTRRRIKLRVEDYLTLDQAGAFERYGKTELIEGEVVAMSPHHRPHARITARLARLLGNALDQLAVGLETLVEGSVAMPPHNVPEPDLAITSEPEGDGLVPLASLTPIVEVSDATIRTDLGRKLRMYAREGVPEYWVVDVKRLVIHQHWDPVDSNYREARSIRFGSSIAAMTIPGLTIDTSGLD